MQVERETEAPLVRIETLVNLFCSCPVEEKIKCAINGNSADNDCKSVDENNNFLCEFVRVYVTSGMRLTNVSIYIVTMVRPRPTIGTLVFRSLAALVPQMERQRSRGLQICKASRTSVSGALGEGRLHVTTLAQVTRQVSL